MARAHGRHSIVDEGMGKSMASSNVYFASDGDFEDKDHFESLLGGTRQRRIGGNQSYRDDPVRNR